MKFCGHYQTCRACTKWAANVANVTKQSSQRGRWWTMPTLPGQQAGWGDGQGYIAHKSMEHVAAKTGQEGYSSDPTDASMWVELKMSEARVEEESGHEGTALPLLSKRSLVARKDKTGWRSTLLEQKGNLTGFTFRLCRSAGHLKDLTCFGWQQEQHLEMK